MGVSECGILLSKGLESYKIFFLGIGGKSILFKSSTINYILVARMAHFQYGI